MADQTKTETFGQKIRKLQASVKPLFAAAQIDAPAEDADEETVAAHVAAVTEAEKNVADLRNKILAAKKLLQDLEHDFDAAVDMRDAGFFGENFLPKITRIRKKREASEKSDKVDELAAVDF